MAKNNKEDLILNGLLSNATIREKAKAINVSESTIYSYLKNNNFKNRYEEAKKRVFEETMNYLQNNIGMAIATIVVILKDKNTPTQLLLQASDMLLKHHIKYQYNYEIIKRIEALENTQNNDD